jgi:alanyl-tRNA synthetase
MAGAGGKDMRLVAEQTSYLAQRNVVQTDDSAKYIWNEPLVACQTMGLFIGRNETEDMLGFVSQLDATQGTVGIILDKTSFYAESGGQTYDTGTLASADGTFLLQVDSVQIYGPFCLHTGRVIQGTISLGDALTCK